MGQSSSKSDSSKLPFEPEIQKPDSEWRKELSPEAYNVLRQAGTEMAFTGKVCSKSIDGLIMPLSDHIYNLVLE
jgi:hypothetical protein